MPIDVEAAVGAPLPPVRYSWSDDDIILYHLGIGAGSRPTDPSELRYVYEGDLHVLPTFANIPPFSMLMGLTALDGVDVNLAQILHGEQETIIHSTIPPTGAVASDGSVVAIFDKGKGALAIVEVVSRLESTGEPVFTNRSSIYLRGEGGFGGDPGPSTGFDMPARPPDHVVESATLPQQALLYRLGSGDKNPLHADPAFAAFAGYERPILHGLCTYGIVAKAVVGSALDGRPEALGSYRARFAGVVFPGETIVTSVWDGGGELFVSAATEERGETVLSNGVVKRR